MYRASTLLSSLVLAILLAAAYPTQGTHSAANLYDGESVNVRDRTFESLTIRKAPNVTLENVTVTGFLRVEDSNNVNIRRSTVTSTFELIRSEGVEFSATTVKSWTSLTNSKRIHLLESTHNSDLYLTDASDVRMERVTLNGRLYLCGQSSLNQTGSTIYPVESCPTATTSPAPATPPMASTAPAPTSEPSPTQQYDYYCDGKLQSTPCKDTASPEPTRTYDYYCDGRFQSTPCDAPPPPPPNENYTFELVGKSVFQDLWVSNAGRVVIKDSRIFGGLGIGWSRNIVLENVYVGGKLHIDQSSRVTIRGLNAGPMFGMSNTRDFEVADSFVGGTLGCYRCASGLYSNVKVGGEVIVVESTDVRRVNVAADAGELPSAPTVPPEAKPGVITLNVTGSSLAFAHVKPIGPDASTEVQLAVNAIQARAALEVPRPRVPEELAIRLESRFEKLQEFEDRDGNGAFDLGDLVLRDYLLNELPIDAITQERLPGDEEGWVGKIVYRLPNGAHLALIFTARDDAPDRTKIDVEITGYSYATARSQLALQVRLASASNWNITTGGGDEDLLVFHGKGFDGVFGWIRTAQADGKETPVTARVLEEHRTATGDREVVLLLGYERARNLLHDPSIGVVEVAGFDVQIPKLGDLVVYGTTFAAVIAVLWALGQGWRAKTPRVR